MNNNSICSGAIRNRSTQFFLFLLSLLLAPVTMADNSRSVTVQASGYVEAVPDTLHLQLSIEKTAKSIAIAKQSVDKTVAKVLDITHQIGVKADDVDNSRISAYPSYEWRNDKRHYLGETVVQDISITLRKLDSYGRLVSQLSALPLLRVYRPNMSHSNITTLHLDALKDAIANGQRKAQVIAEELEVKLGQVLSVRDELASRPSPIAFQAATRSRQAADGNEVGFSYAKQRITASVQIQFELQ